jgi:hypothetical protein
MQVVFFIKVLHILSADDIDFFVPIGIQRSKFGEFFLLGFCQVRKVLEDKVHKIE